jgi:hypothetical protein
MRKIIDKLSFSILTVILGIGLILMGVVGLFFTTTMRKLLIDTIDQTIIKLKEQSII